MRAHRFHVFCLTQFTIIAVMLLASCDIAEPLPLVTRTLSAPALAATDPAFPAPPSEIPAGYIDPFGSSNPTAAGLPSGLAVPPIAIGTPNPISGATQVQITLRDGVRVTADLLTNVETRSPGIILLSEDTDSWGDLPLGLSREGFIVLNVRIRGFENPFDLLDVIDSFSDLAEGDTALLDPGRIAVIGERNGAELALRGCVQDRRCDALIMLSPQNSAILPLGAQMGERPIWIAASANDVQSFSTAQGIAAGSLNVSLVMAEGGASGAALLADTSLLSPLLVWLRSAIG